MPWSPKNRISESRSASRCVSQPGSSPWGARGWTSLHGTASRTRFTPRSGARWYTTGSSECTATPRSCTGAPSAVTKPVPSMVTPGSVSSTGSPEVGAVAGVVDCPPPDALPPPVQDAASRAAATSMHLIDERATVPGYARNRWRLHAVSIVVEARPGHLAAEVERQARREPPDALVRRCGGGAVALARGRHRQQLPGHPEARLGARRASRVGE